jgi:DNA-directed RNA polymerase subunit K/omega
MRKKSALVATMALVCSVSAFAEGKPKPMKIFVFAGQSNMTGMARPHTLEHIKMSPETAAEYADIFDKDGKPVTLDAVYVSQWMDKRSGRLEPIYGGGGGFGPEYACGIYLHKELQEPFLIIKTSLGGSSLNYRYRSPSAATWTPPLGHPDSIKDEKVVPKTPPPAIPEKLELADDWTPAKPHALRRRYLGITDFRGAEIGKVGDIHPIYLLTDPKVKLEGNPFQKGDLILGVDGVGLGESPVDQWRAAFHGSKTLDGDWMMKKEAIEYEKKRGYLYRDMIAYVKSVLSDVKQHHPAYDPAAGYELAGFVWFQGWNDMIDSGTYPNRDKPGGYDQYTWLVENLIRDVRKDLDAPDMPTVIGVMGIGGLDVEGTIGNFQNAQAAVTEKPEFKDNVIAVETGKYWDHDLAALAARSHQVNQHMNVLKHEQGLEGDALKKAFAEYRAKHITPQEEEILKVGISDGDFHYLGSAKIMCGIGRGFGEALIQAMNRSKR